MREFENQVEFDIVTYVQEVRIKKDSLNSTIVKHETYHYIY